MDCGGLSTQPVQRIEAQRRDALARRALRRVASDASRSGDAQHPAVHADGQVDDIVISTDTADSTDTVTTTTELEAAETAADAEAAAMM